MRSRLLIKNRPIIITQLHFILIGQLVLMTLLGFILDYDIILTCLLQNIRSLYITSLRL